MEAKIKTTLICFVTPLILVLTMTGCGYLVASETSHQSRNPFTVVPENRLILLDESKHNVTWIRGSQAASESAQFVFNGQSLGMSPYRKWKGILHRMTPISTGLFHQMVRVPLDGQTVVVAGWKAVELPNNKILIVGGTLLGDNTKCLRNTWLFDDKSNSVTAGPTMSVGRYGHSVLALKDGRVLVSGGVQQYGSASPVSSCEIYDWKANEIAEFGNMQLPRSEHSTVQLENGHVLIAGGKTTEALSRLSENLAAPAELLDLTDKHSMVVGKLNLPRRSADLVSYGKNQALVIGGWMPDFNGDSKRVWVAEIFTDPSSNQTSR